jgi:hypothetical protein
MASEPASASTQATKAELDVISNRVAIALAKREKLIKSWTTSSARERRPEKTQEELDADDAALFRVEPPHLGVGAPVPSHFLISDAEQNHKSLRQKFFPTKGLKASKQRDAEEKAASAKRGLKEESSDDEGGRSSLGKAKKRKISPTVKGNEDDTTAKLEEGEGKQEPIKVGSRLVLVLFYAHRLIMILETSNPTNNPTKSHYQSSTRRGQRRDIWKFNHSQ